MKIAIMSLILLIGCDDSATLPPPTSQPSVNTSLPSNFINPEVIPATEGQYKQNGGPIIANLSVGQGCWIEPWTMWLCSSGNHYINATHNFYLEKEGKDRIWIKKMEKGFGVYLAETKYKWSKMDIDDDGVDFSLQGVPVVEIKK